MTPPSQPAEQADEGSDDPEQEDGAVGTVGGDEGDEEGEETDDDSTTTLVEAATARAIQDSINAEVDALSFALEDPEGLEQVKAALQSMNMRIVHDKRARDSSSTPPDSSRSGAKKKKAKKPKKG